MDFAICFLLTPSEASDHRGSCLLLPYASYDTGVHAPLRLLKDSLKREAWKEFQFLEVIGLKVLANEGVLGEGESRATRKACF